MGKTIRERARKTEVVASYDIVVVGGGIAGVAAALAARRNGASACIIEKEHVLGGLATLGLVVYYLPLCDGHGTKLVGGIGEELLKNSLKYGPGAIPRAWRGQASEAARSRDRYQVVFNAASYMISLEELVLKNRVAPLYDTRFCDVSINKGKIEAVIVENKSGRLAIGCRVVIDASGDADVCKAAGEKTASTGNMGSAWFFSYDKSKLGFHYMIDPDSTRKRYRGDDWRDVIAMDIRSREMVMKEIRKLKKGNKNIYPLVIPTLPQFRTTRRLVGGFELDERDDKKSFDDSIGMVGDWRVAGPVFQIPYRCLTAHKVTNLLTAGRCISVTRSAWEVTRAIPACAVTGQAAGTAAALTARSGGAVRDLKVQELRQVLRRQKVILSSQ